MYNNGSVAAGGLATGGVAAGGLAATGLAMNALWIFLAGFALFAAALAIGRMLPKREG